ncbi:MAG: MerR family transcriptional regulator [Chloroflexota bacterium]|nr:MAG: MerR family transcriptional regulator [Chloroflexota bacterium]
MARRHYLRTSEISKAVGVHPNTVRLYEQWGFLSPVARSPSGYRQFTEAHLDQMRLARLALHGGWPGRAIRRSALALVRQTASGDLESALAQAQHHLTLVQAERAQAEEAAAFLERWARGNIVEAAAEPLSIGQTAQLLAVTIDILRNWERNGLLAVPRDPTTGYRRYSPAEIGRLRVIRLLLRAGYSMMAVLRMLLQLDQGRREGLREALDTPRPDEDILTAADQWLTTLAEQEQRAREMIVQLEAMIAKRESR